MREVGCLIFESCKHQCTSDCFRCENNELADEIDDDYYEFNNWDESENDYQDD